MTSEEARQQAQAEKLTLVVAETKTGYFGVSLDKPGRPKPYKARVRRCGKHVGLGYFATAEEAALCVARTPEGRAAAGRAAAAERQGMSPAVSSGATLKEEDTVPLMPPGTFVKEEGAVPPMPPGARFKKEGAVPPMPSDAFVKQEHEIVVVVKEEEGSTSRPKRHRSE